MVFAFVVAHGVFDGFGSVAGSIGCCVCGVASCIGCGVCGIASSIASGLDNVADRAIGAARGCEQTQRGKHREHYADGFLHSDSLCQLTTEASFGRQWLPSRSPRHKPSRGATQIGTAAGPMMRIVCLSQIYAGFR